MSNEPYQHKDYQVKFVINPNPKGTSTRTDNSEAAQNHKKALEAYEDLMEEKKLSEWWD
jgi:hypothetical protein